MAKTSPDDSVYPSVDETKTYDLPPGLCTEFFGKDGLSKREYFAAMAMQGMLADSERNGSSADYAEGAVQLADALIKSLNKEGGE